MNDRSYIIVLSCAIGTLVSVTALAQSDSPKQDSTSQPQIPYESKVNVNYQKWDDVLPAKAEDVPAQLQKVLQSDAYKGWETGEILRSSDGNMFEFRIGTGEEQKVYRFTPTGVPIKSDL
jgi:hypothetical protein